MMMGRGQRDATCREKGEGSGKATFSRPTQGHDALEHKCTDLRNVNGTRGHRISFTEEYNYWMQGG